MKPKVTVAVFVSAPIEKIWERWTEPKHIMRWCFASDDWCAPRAENDLQVGGIFRTRMEVKDGSVGFDFEGTYTTMEKNKKLEYVLAGDDARKVSIEFVEQGDGYKVVEVFEAEAENSLEMQKNGWQAILDNFKKYAESDKTGL